MVWINNFFYILLTNAAVGSVAYLLSIPLCRWAEHRGDHRLIYNLLRGVEVFYMVPFAYLYVKLIRGARIAGFYTGYDGNTIVAMIGFIGFLVWLIGACWYARPYWKEYKTFRWLCSYNIPTEDDVVREMINSFYPHKRLRRLRLYTNFQVPSPCIVGIIRPKLLMPEQEYPLRYLRPILAHEATHVIHRDNLWKRIGMFIVIGCWWNPLIRPYSKAWQEWTETHCDATVCENFMEGEKSEYAMILWTASQSPAGALPPDISFFGEYDTIAGRIQRLNKIRIGKGRVALSIALSAILIAGSAVTAVAAGNVSSEVGVTAYKCTLNEVTTTNVLRYNLNEVDNVNVFQMSAEEVAALGDAIVVLEPEDGVDTLATQVDFDWDVAAGDFGVSSNFLKRKDKLIEASAYITSSDGSVKFGVIEPDGTFSYAVAPANRNTSIEYTTVRLGYYKVAVYNQTSATVNADGYYVK